MKYLFGKELEEKSINIINQFDSSYLNIPDSLPEEELLYFFGLDLQYVNFCDPDVLGAFVFEPGYVKILDSNGEVYEQYFDKNVVLIDSFEAIKNLHRAKFTMFHEVSHFILHSKTQKKIHIDGKAQIRYFLKSDYHRELKTDEDVIEWQANYLVSCLQINNQALALFINSLKSNYEYPSKGGFIYMDEDERKCIIEKTSRQFNVSFRAAEIRLEVRRYIAPNNQSESYYK